MSVMEAWLMGRRLDDDRETSGGDPRKGKLTRLRDEGLSQRRAAEVLGVSQAQVSKLSRDFGIQWKRRAHD